ncbi:MAG: hypothetical protein QM564_11875 [Bergeyella sp.]
MKNTIAVLSVFALFMTSCEKKNAEDTVVKPDFDSTALAQQSLPDTEILETNCFLSANGKDSLLLSYEDNLGTIIGKIRYKNSDKDSTKGDISGLMDGDTLKLTYMFETKGAPASREIWFLKKENQLLEGIGKYDASGELYENYKNINFDGRTLNSVDCKTIEKELK